jgi:hypothetical protein
LAIKGGYWTVCDTAKPPSKAGKIGRTTGERESSGSEINFTVTREREREHRFVKRFPGFAPSCF